MVGIPSSRCVFMAIMQNVNKNKMGSDLTTSESVSKLQVWILAIQKSQAEEY